MILIFSIAMCADYSFELISIVHGVPHFFMYNKSILGAGCDIVHKLPIEDHQWQTYARNDTPSQKSKKLQLNLLCHPIVGHKRVQNPQSDVCKEQECNQLSTGFGNLLRTCGTNSTSSLCNNHP